MACPEKPNGFEAPVALDLKVTLAGSPVQTFWLDWNLEHFPANETERLVIGRNMRRMARS